MSDEGHECVQCDKSKADVASFKGSPMQRGLFRFDEALHRYECRHGNHPRLGRLRSALCQLVDWRVNGVPMRTLYRKSTKETSR